MFSISKMSEIAPMGGGQLFSKMSEIQKSLKQAGAELGQAQLKLGLDFD